MSERGGPGPAATSDALAGTQWEIVSIDGQAVGAEEPLVIEFGHDARVFGSTGVNSFTASYSIAGGYLSIGPMATTRRAAEPDRQAQEHLVVGSFAGNCPVTVTARTLTVDGPLGRVELVTTQPAPMEVPQAPPPEGVTG